jgi:enamine deaminase RidA (YjgF/YER057c/UK114 family)
MSQDSETRLRGLGLELPTVPSSAGTYVPATRAGNLVFTAGQLPFQDGELYKTGKVCAEVSPDEAYEAAMLCAVNALAAAAAEAGGLGGIDRIVKVTGFVASAPGFNGQPGVLNGASELLGEVFGEASLHARSAVGVAELPPDAPVEVEIVVVSDPSVS